MRYITDEISNSLRNQQRVPLENITRFFKTGVGSYSEHDKFLGIQVPLIRKVAKKYSDASFENLKDLIFSIYNEERFLALVMLMGRYKQYPEDAYNFYLKNIDQVNNWNLVDLSAHHVLGSHLFRRKRNPLYELANSFNIWHRRISIISTFYFIKNGDFDSTLYIAKNLLRDQHDLIHKATGWMLREVGKKDILVLNNFLNENLNEIHSTTLRYATEKFSKEKQAQIFEIYDKCKFQKQ